MDNTENENFDSQNEELDEALNQSDESTVEQTDEEKEKLAESNKRLFERAKKAESELKALKAQGQSQTITTNSVDPEELKLIARGLSDEEIEQAKVIAKGTGTTLNEALKNDLFTAYQEKLKETQRKEKAKLQATRGSGQTESDRGITGEESREEHLKKWKEAQG